MNLHRLGWPAISGSFAGKGVYGNYGQHLFGIQMSDRLQELAVFVRAAESGSFSRAARELGLSQPSVSRIIGELETRLGVTLLLRTTRRITVTDAGATVSRTCHGKFSRRSRTPKTPRVASTRFAASIRLAHSRRVRHPRESSPGWRSFSRCIRCCVSNCPSPTTRQDLVAEGADIAIRMGNLDDSAFGARKLQTLQTNAGRIAVLSGRPRCAEDTGRSRHA